MKLQKHNVCYNDTNCLHILCRSYRKKNVLLKFIEPCVWSPTVRTWTQLTMLNGGCPASMYRTPISSLDISKTVCTCTCLDNLDQHIIDKSIDHWREWWPRWTVVLTIWFICCSALSRSICILRIIRAFCHCVSSIIVVLWEKVNLANNLLDISG